MYPSTANAPKGKLRLMYECSPLAFIIEQNRRKSHFRRKRILDIVPKSLHERVPLFIGSKHMIDKLEELIKVELDKFKNHFLDEENVIKVSSLLGSGKSFSLKNISRVSICPNCLFSNRKNRRVSFIYTSRQRKCFIPF